MEAEKARVLGQVVEAIDSYERAIKGAKDNEYIQEEALAYELAAKFYLARGMEKFAQTYMKEAHYYYERWGATAKVKDLETRYPQFFPQPPGIVDTLSPKASKSTSSTSHIAFDLVSVLKASQAISREIELEQVLRSLMQILMENAGAQTGCLILENAGEWTIEAACKFHEGEQTCATRVLQSIPLTNYLPESIIQYVIRTHESVILDDAAHGDFSHDSYIQQYQIQSLLCLPLLNQSKLVGVLYLENQLTAGAFTPERSQVLNLLSTQAAIAAFQDITERKQAEHLLANYNRTLEQQVAERTAALQQSEAALRQQEQELRLITNALPALISYVDANRCYQFVNHTHEIWFSRSCDEISGNSVHELLGETVYPVFEPSINQVFEGQTITLEAELPFLQGKRCISATLIPDFDANAQVRGFYSLHHRH